MFPSIRSLGHNASKQQIGEVYRAVSSLVLRRLPLKEAKSSTAGLALKDTFRKPNETLYLLVKKPRKHHAYQFPQGGQDPGETTSEAALRELREECGSSLKVKLIDETPIGAYQYKFPPEFNRWDQSVGAKVIMRGCIELIYYISHLICVCKRRCPSLEQIG